MRSRSRPDSHSNASNPDVKLGLRSDLVTARIFSLMASSALLASCAVATPVAIQSSGPALSGDHAVELVVADELSPLHGQFASALAEAFARHDVDTGQGAPLIADFALSVSFAEAGVVAQNSADEAAPASEQDIDWTAKPRSRRLFDKCDAQRARATLFIVDRTSGETVYRGEAEKIDCEIGKGAVSELAASLVDDAARLR